MPPKNKKMVVDMSPPPQVDALIPVTKNGQTIRVCHAQLEQHQFLGWIVHAHATGDN
ncbi:hypothetical protein [Syntrophotalea acetylenica]|uniref:hypothetical protein n=1 Tax=Syntrophotalea acetylenica TaxID=29542 RepID=UPI000AB183CA|nr:hypothetical protein [Syntrophotalea acetylenica]